jgi:saccharopine dehydrogenase-like NADP-dependent oxidoreductase
VTPQEELDVAQLDYEQAEDRVGLEYRNWMYFQNSYSTLMQSMLDMGLSQEKAQENFNTSMQAYADSFGHALEQRALASTRLADVIKRFPHLMLSPSAKPKRRLGI